MHTRRAAEAPRTERTRAGSPEAPRPRVLIVEDDRQTRSLLATVLSDSGYETQDVDSGEAALDALNGDPPDVILLDLHMPGLSGLETLARLRARQVPTRAIVMTGDASLESSIQALRLGAFDYLTKPLNRRELLDTLARALTPAVPPRRIAPDSQARVRRSTLEFVGESPSLHAMFELIERVAPFDATVLVTGETGSGKELVARAIHALSTRRDRPLIAVHCAALSSTLLESELFGHVKGSFTGATTNRRGLFEEAAGGTLFLDETSTIPLEVQVKILRVLQERTLQRVGSNEAITTDFRLIAATNVDLAAEVAAGRFREDLYYRLHVFPIHVPALRERPSDIPLLVESFRQRFAATHKVEPAAFTEETLAHLMEYDWPGNVRELENFVERALIAAGTKPIVDMPAPKPREKRADREVLSQAHRDAYTLAELTREYTLKVLDETSGKEAETASILGISRRTLSRKLKRYKDGALDDEDDADDDA
ncbi:MAG TPA: sigma-54 dependent transcriptional regulator [Gemmatimonadaceae bacterium]|nr:sigma-54 dependent transcriptional regulator [Gemmatimonadaceae bacterium]